MQVKRNCVFGSAAERTHFAHLLEQWANRAHVYHNLPFLQVFNLDSLTALLKLGEIESSRLKKTSLDFVVCDKQDRPLVAIDFDGLSQGFSAGTSYLAPAGATRWRKQIFELKLLIAHSCRFPYLIVRSAQFRFLPGDAKLTGVIGSVLANIKAREDWGTVNMEKVTLGLEERSIKEQAEAMQDLSLQIETAAEVESCPITARRWELFRKLGITRYGLSPLYSRGGYGVEARVWRVDTQASARVWMLAFGVTEISVLAIVENLGSLVAAEKLGSQLTTKMTDGAPLPTATNNQQRERRECPERNYS